MIERQWQVDQSTLYEVMNFPEGRCRNINNGFCLNRFIKQAQYTRTQSRMFLSGVIRDRMCVGREHSGLVFQKLFTRSLQAQLMLSDMFFADLFQLLVDVNTLSNFHRSSEFPFFSSFKLCSIFNIADDDRYHLAASQDFHRLARLLDFINNLA